MKVIVTVALVVLSGCASKRVVPVLEGETCSHKIFVDKETKTLIGEVTMGRNCTAKAVVVEVPR